MIWDWKVRLACWVWEGEHWTDSRTPPPHQTVSTGDVSVGSSEHRPELSYPAQQQGYRSKEPRSLNYDPWGRRWRQLHPNNIKWEVSVVIIIIIYPVAVVLQWHNTKIYISHKISHHSQTKHSTRSYTHNKGHITHNEYNPKKVKLSPQQAT
jgi:hypothetical protein